MVVGTAVASAWGAPNFTPEWQPLLILLVMALLSQVIGWVATSSALPRLDSSTGSMLLLAQPLVAIILAVWFTSFASARRRRRGGR